MPGNPQASVFIGNLDEKVDERVVYEIMVQAGPLVDVYMPRDKDTKRHKGYAFAEFTSEKSAQYAVSLFSGLVSLHKKLLRFSISGQDKVANSNEMQPQLQERKDLKSSSISFLDYSSHYAQRTHTSVRSPLVDFSSHVGRLGFPSIAVENSYSGLGQRLDFSPLAHSQNYNARLVSLGQAGLGSHLQSRDHSIAYRSY